MGDKKEKKQKKNSTMAEEETGEFTIKYVPYEHQYQRDTTVSPEAKVRLQMA